MRDDLPLAGTVVVAVEQAVAAPLCTRHLADLGARVIKVERPDGGDFSRSYDHAVNGLSAYFVWANRSKESVVLDITEERGRRALDELIATADVFIHNLAPASARKLGIDAATLSSRHERLVACDISGYGEGGPMSDRKAYDLLLQAEAGFLSVTGTADDLVKSGISIADIAAGIYAYSSILAALLRRGRTGTGCAVEVSMIDALTEWMSMPLYYGHYGGVAPRRTGAEHATIAPYGPFATSDGQVLLAIQNEREWRRLCAEVLGDPAMADDDRFATNSLRVANRPALHAAMDAVLTELTAAEVMARLDAAGVAYGQVNALEDVWDHPQLRARDRFTTVDSPVGPIEVLRPPAEPPGGAAFGPVPALGQHTDAVLRELGLLEEADVV
ncbi:MAG: CoA-transferase [Actinomycetia bacterium]|nr:CoA-transferase [Actinomycetes bacterium]